MPSLNSGENQCKKNAVKGVQYVKELKEILQTRFLSIQIVNGIVTIALYCPVYREACRLIMADRKKGKLKAKDLPWVWFAFNHDCIRELFLKLIIGQDDDGHFLQKFDEAKKPTHHIQCDLSGLDKAKLGTLQKVLSEGDVSSTTRILTKECLDYFLGAMEIIEV